MGAKATLLNIRSSRTTGVVAIAIAAACLLLFFFDAAELRTCSHLHVKSLIRPGKSISGVSGSLFLGNKLHTFTGHRVAASMPPARQQTNIAPAGVSGGRWAVCTTIFEPSQAIVRAVALSGWSVVIVGDKGGAAFNLTAPNLVFLDVPAQQQMAADYAGLIDLLPWKHFGRKNLGYLYAVAHGAHTIWDFDDDNILKQGVQPALPSHKVYHVAVDRTTCEAFNPYPYMGGPAYTSPSMPQSWPRGFPLQLIKQPCTATLLPGDTSTVAVVQSLADHDPDVDGIYRLTRGVPFNFNPNSGRTIVLPHGTLAPWNAQATLALQPALWSLLLPVSVHGRVSDIWRSYISQRLLWDVGFNIAFSPPMVDQLRSPHNYLADMQAEEDLYYKSGQLVKFLRQWKGTSSTLPGRFEELVIEMYERGYLGLQDVELTQQWLLALAHAGYQFPALQDTSTPVASAAAAAAAAMPNTSRTAESVDGGAAVPAAGPAHKVLDASERRLKWAVFTSVKAPTNAIKALAALDGWQVVVVADRSTPGNWSWPNVTFLSVQQQQTLGYSVLRHIPFDNHARKNIGYLYAISHEAHAVYDGADTCQLMQDFVPMLTCADTGSEIIRNVTAAPYSGLYTVADATHSGMFDPQQLFQSSQRRTARSSFGSVRPDQLCFTRQAAAPLIQHSMMNTKEVTVDPTAFSVVLPRNMMAPFSSHNTLFLQDALWAMLLPTGPRCFSDSWRSFWAQRLLWEVGGNLAISTASAINLEPSDSAECNPYKDKFEALAEDLLALQWTTNTLPDRMLEAAATIAAKGHIPLADVELMQAWIRDLRQAGYKFPALQQYTGKAPAAPTVRLTPQMIMAAPMNDTFLFPRRWCLHQDKALVVNFNRLGQYNSVQQIKLLHAAYRPLFSRVLFTGITGSKPGPELQEHINQRRMYGCDSYESGMKDNPGFMAYACATGVLASDSWGSGLQGTPGMFYINDDIIFSPCMLSKFKGNNIWYTSTLNTTVPASSRKGWRWQWRETVLNYTTTKALQQAIAQSYGLMAQRKAAYFKGEADSFNFGQADVFYLPARFQKEYIAMAHQMRALHVISEAALPNILGLLRGQPADIEPFSFAWAWSGERTCLDNQHTAVMPLHSNLNATVIHECVKGYMYAERQSDKDGFFALHPVKFSNTTIAQHWLDWWVSQSC